MKKSIAIIGGGASALLFASKIDTKKYNVTLYEKNKALGRKLLVAGKGGFNLTHSEDIELLKTRYCPSNFLSNCLSSFTNKDLIKWLDENQIPTFIGSSKRVFPKKGIKPIFVLEKIIESINKNKVVLKNEHKWSGWDTKNELTFENKPNVNVEIVVFALGGKSWSITGSTGTWTDIIKEKKIDTLPFQASNCAFEFDWDKEFIDKYEGQPLKNIQISCSEKSQRGEAVLTRYGIEGNAIYALSPEIRKQLKANDKATIYIDLKPTNSEKELLNKLSDSKQANITKSLKQDLKLSKTALSLVKTILSKDEFQNPNILVKRIKNLPLLISGLAPLDEAISTVGGIDRRSLTSNFELKLLPNHFCIGEMIDWDAPTGGYLLQGCFSMGAYLASYLNKQP